MSYGETLTFDRIGECLTVLERDISRLACTGSAKPLIPYIYKCASSLVEPKIVVKVACREPDALAPAGNRQGQPCPQEHQS